MAKTKPKINERQIEVTSEYDVFERMPGNRPVDEHHVANLMKRMRRRDLFTPIQINQNFEVIDGQHRLEARRRLGLPVPYFATTDYGLEEVQELNAQQKKWSIDDFVKSFIELGKAHYKTYQWFRRQFQLPHVQTVELLMDGDKDLTSRNCRDIFLSGNFKVVDLEKAKAKAQMVTAVQPFFDHWNNRGFVKALLFCVRKKDFDFKKFLGKLENQPTALKPQATTDLYIQHIEDIYNYRSSNKVSLRYGEDMD